MKKLLSLLLALIMMLGTLLVLASCGDEDPPPTPDEPGDNTDPPTNNDSGYAWTKEDNKTINMKINLDNSSWVNLGKRYIAGADETANGRVDELILQRNDLAKQTTMLNVNYSYWEAGDPKGAWNYSDDTIVADKNAFDEKSSPDIYVTAIYDCILASFQDGLANVAGKIRDGGKNYFTFVKDSYDPANNDKGYNYDLMRSMSPIPDSAMFMVSSDYTIDVFRALHAMPVSVTLLEGLNAESAAEKGVTGIDKDSDGVMTMEELFEFTMEGKWTFDVMAGLCAAVYKPAGSGEAEESFGDNVFGFYLDSYGGSSARALVNYYTASPIFEKVYDVNGVPTYTQNGNEAIMPVATAYEKLMSVKGVMRVGNDDVAPYTSLSTEQYKDLANPAISEKFGNNQVLFAEWSLIGAIEYGWYQNMEGFFGILPMPQVAASADGQAHYTTALGNAARVAVIGASTDDFMEATAYLDYQSTNSSDIIKAYWRSQQYEATNGESYNVDMLAYLRTIMVNQEFHIMDLHAQNYLKVMTETEKAKYFTGEESDYYFTNQNTYLSVTDMFRDKGVLTDVISTNYSQQFINTINIAYKIIVDRYVDAAKKL